MIYFDKIIIERLEKETKELNTPFSASQCGFESEEKDNFYCSRRRVFSCLRPDILEGDENFKNVIIKGFFTELAILFILRDALKGKSIKVYSNPEWKITLGEEVIVHPDLWIPSLSEIHEIKATYKIPEEPYFHHKIQVGIQKLACPKKENKAFIHYIEFTGREYKQKTFEIEDLSKEIIDKIIEENLRIKKFLNEGVIPPINEKFEPTKFPCSWFSNKKFVFCPFFNECYRKTEIIEEKNIIELSNFPEEKIIRLNELLNKEKELKIELDRIALEKKHILSALFRTKEAEKKSIVKCKNFLIEKDNNKVKIIKLNQINSNLN